MNLGYGEIEVNKEFPMKPLGELSLFSVNLFSINVTIYPEVALKDKLQFHGHFSQIIQ